jgi:hypothetical protein
MSRQDQAEDPENPEHGASREQHIGSREILPCGSGSVLTMVGRHFIRLAAAGFLLMLAIACQGCGGWSGPRLVPAGGNPNVSMNGIPAVSPAHHALVGEMVLCLTGPGRAVITGIRPIHPAGTIDVLGFAVRPNPALIGAEMLGAEYGTLRAYGFTASRTVDTPCGASDSGHGYELALELAVPPGTNAGTTGWEIDYKVGDLGVHVDSAERTASMTFPLGAVLCSTPSLDDEPCRRVWRQFGMHW